MGLIAEVALGLVIGLAFVWVVANVVGWISVRDGGELPWSWRILLGPAVFYGWLERSQT